MASIHPAVDNGVKAGANKDDGCTFPSRDANLLSATQTSEPFPRSAKS
jgi:hypothetical protein